MDKDKLLFYDIEVFEKDALVVFMDIDGKEVAHFWNDPNRKTIDDASGFEGIPKVIEGKTLVGFNNYHYDDYILSKMLNEAGNLPEYIKLENDMIIRGPGSGREINSDIYSLDTMQQIDVSKPSLKQIEGNLGISIVESSVPFDIKGQLTPDQRDEVLEYCRNDVRATVEIYKLREKSYFEVKQGLLAMLDESERGRAYRWNTTTLAARVLLGNNKSKAWTAHKVPKKYWRNVPGIPEDVWTMWEDIFADMSAATKKSKTVKAFDCKVVFGMGGLHAAPSKPCRYGRCKHKDVASMYPSAIVHLNALGDATDKYDGMRKERIAIKHTDPVKAGALKLILNSVYGNFRNQYSPLQNELASGTVCVYGQIALFSLCMRLHEAGYKVINANTDGVVYVDDPGLGGVDEQISTEWEQEFDGFKLETDVYKQWIQRDVNNYIAVTEDGEIEVKGGDVNKYQVNKWFSNNNARIVQIALVDYLVYNKPILDTLLENRDKPLLWQFVLKAGSTYLRVEDASGTEQNKVNRVFAAMPNVEGVTKLYKIRQDGGRVNFPDVPERMLIWNESVNDIPDFEKIIDIGYYMTLVENKLKGWCV